MKTLIYTLTLLSFAVPMLANEVSEVAAIAVRYNLQNEVRLEDGTRADLISEDYAIEVDWSAKWAEGIGQALFYSEMTSKAPGVLLLRKSDQSMESHDIYVARCRRVCFQKRIALWEATEGDSKVIAVYEPVSPFTRDRP